MAKHIDDKFVIGNPMLAFVNEALEKYSAELDNVCKEMGGDPFAVSAEYGKPIGYFLPKTMLEERKKIIREEIANGKSPSDYLSLMEKRTLPPTPYVG